MRPKEREVLFGRFLKQNPTPTTELIFHSPFELLIAVILSAQATDRRVNQVTEKLFKTAPTPEAIAHLGTEGLEAFLKSLNYYHTKTKHILQLCQILLSKHQGKIPSSRSALEALPGVGRKSANVILNTVFKKPTIAVDTHIFRVANRTGLAPGKTVWEVEQKLMRVVPSKYRLHTHHWLLLHGRYICTTRNPKCLQCLIQDLCAYQK